jgi:hypothetical protein
MLPSLESWLAHASIVGMKSADTISWQIAHADQSAFSLIVEDGDWSSSHSASPSTNSHLHRAGDMEVSFRAAETAGNAFANVPCFGVARAHHWRQMLLDGKVSSTEAIVARFGLDRGHVGLTLNLAFLSPAMTRMIVRGEQPPDLRLVNLLAADIPLSWEQQRELLFESPSAL